MLAPWPRVAQRVTVMPGGKDDLVPSASADFAQKMLTRAQSVSIVRMPEMNHFLPWTRHAQVKAVSLAHLQQDPGGLGASMSGFEGHRCRRV
jgi:pimeloyl-ACP methyl ester carboxylesterase